MKRIKPLTNERFVREELLKTFGAATPRELYHTAVNVMRDEVKCKDCIYFDLQEGFNSSNLRRCSVDGRKHWKGDDADYCMNFAFREADRYAS